LNYDNNFLNSNFCVLFQSRLFFTKQCTYTICSRIYSSYGTLNPALYILFITTRRSRKLYRHGFYIRNIIVCVYRYTIAVRRRIQFTRNSWIRENSSRLYAYKWINNAFTHAGRRACEFRGPATIYVYEIDSENSIYPHKKKRSKHIFNFV